jgi:hypothetical protein
MYSVIAINFATTISAKTFTNRLIVSSMKSRTSPPPQHTERCTFINLGDIGFVAAYGRPVIGLGIREGTVLTVLPPLTNLLLLSIFFMISHNKTLHRKTRIQNSKSRIRDHVHARIHIEKSIVRN